MLDSVMLIYSVLLGHDLNISIIYLKNINTKYSNHKIEDKDIIGIYYFSNFNSSIEKELSNLGLIAIENKSISIKKRILLIIYDSYLYLLILTLLVYTIKISCKRSQEGAIGQSFDSLQWLTKKNVLLLMGIHCSLFRDSLDL